jgi:hypothetical protein
MSTPQSFAALRQRAFVDDQSARAGAAERNAFLDRFGREADPERRLSPEERTKRPRRAKDSEQNAVPMHVNVMTWSHNGQTVNWTTSWEQVTLDGVDVPAWVEERRHGGGGPDLTIRAAVRDGVPETVDLRYTSAAGQGEVRQKHLREFDVDRVAVDLYAGVPTAIKLEVGEDITETRRVAQKFIEHQRLPREYRVINNEFLKQVADIYRQNIAHAPARAVAKKFGVQPRMA